MSSDPDFLIVEDELLIAEMISEILENAGHKLTRITDSVEGAIKEIEMRRPSMVLTDIALGRERSGIDLGKLLHNDYKIPFIYISSHSSPEILGQAKHTRPNAYIVKPFKAEDLLVAIELAMFNSSVQTSVPEKEELMVKDGRAMIRLPYNEILWLEADGNYTTFHVKSGKRRVVRTSISEYESQLNEHYFIRIHKSYIVNHNLVDKVTSSSIFINGQELSVGRTYQPAVASLFNKK
jgi:two-component system, LytTR family, response regulator LytT